VMSVAVRDERFILTAKLLSGHSLSGTPDRVKLFYLEAGVSGGDS
jgi:hypothetical protein